MTYTVPEINEKVKDIKKSVEKSERYYNNKILALTEEILKDKSKKAVLIAGPSSSGKTTTAHLLCESLNKKGIKTHVISLDNFYLPKHRLPKTKTGETDYESVHALNIEEINRCMEELVNKGSTTVPKYDFTASDEQRKERVEITLKNNELAIIEGLHALNPLLYKNLALEDMYKIYISLSSKIHNKNKETLLSSKDLRLVRRIVRDYNFRNSSVQNTFDMWPGVIIGEEKSLYCFKHIADFKFDTFLSYEPLIFKVEILKLLSQITPESDDYGLAQKLCYGMKQFCSASVEEIPKNSLLNEFVAKR